LTNALSHLTKGRSRDHMQGRTGPPGTTRWVGWSAGQVGRHVKCWSRSNV